MKPTRRSALSMLGLAAPTALSVEAFTKPNPEPNMPRTGRDAYDTERCAQAFELLAAEIRSGAIQVQSLVVTASLSPDQIDGQHELVFNFYYKPEA